MKNKIVVLNVVIVFLLNGTDYKSQYGQDKFLNEHYFKNKTNGVFVDIGAHDGITLSNTWFYEKDLEWEGVCFEPIPSVYQELCKNRKCLCINQCVSNKNEIIEFREVVGYSQMLSGIEDCYDQQDVQRIKNEIAQKGGTCKFHRISSCLLNSVLKENNIYHIDLLSIDVEGAELSILASIDYDTFYFYIICVENQYSQHLIRDFLTSKGFKYITNVGTDDIFINAKA